MLVKTLLAFVGLSLIGCSGQQVSEAVTEPALMQTPQGKEQTAQTVTAPNLQPQAQPVLQAVIVTDAAKAKIADSGANNKGSKKDRPMEHALLEAKLLVTDKANVTLQYTNNQSYGVPLMFMSGMTADLWLLDAQGSKIWAWSNEMMFTQAIRETVMPAGKTQNVKFKIPADVAAKIGKGYRLEAVFAGKATESQKPAMSKVTYSY
ncbi:BsuPI-related putative proteinase inhibitor [Shewanella sp. 1CM18E]|uniref:BsuPI-related putative proteinase inhibitor n=1 Tax=Shewanella sp. 1CM18E TaxID=2929169 RepID=UPI0020BE2D9B|nr:BsuPI-related putative proteinase inhibitor [Shewanella sp. 1CM18E]MCK8045215.1 BsuPI-related putative proteinase inhibitor [Shewanella sp. 1CM18E]